MASQIVSKVPGVGRWLKLELAGVDGDASWFEGGGLWLPKDVETEEWEVLGSVVKEWGAMSAGRCGDGGVVVSGRRAAGASPADWSRDEDFLDVDLLEVCSDGRSVGI